MFFIGALAFFAFFSMRYLQNLSQKIEMEVLFYSDIKEADIDALEKQIKLKPYIESSRVSSREENTRTAQQIIGSNFTEVISNPINASVIINVKPQYANSDSLNKISKELKRNPIVQDVDYPDFIVKSISNNFRKIQWVILAICAVFMIISMLLVANSIRLNIFAKRFNIKSMLLVGATPKFVRRPFVTKGMLQGIWGGIIAVALLALALFYGNRMAPDFVDFSAMLYIVIILAAVFVFSMLFTMLISAFSVNKYIRINDERLYM
jgi:cell division transport system permease protein